MLLGQVEHLEVVFKFVGGRRLVAAVLPSAGGRPHLCQIVVLQAWQIKCLGMDSVRLSSSSPSVVIIRYWLFEAVLRL